MQLTASTLKANVLLIFDSLFTISLRSFTKCIMAKSELFEQFTGIIYAIVANIPLESLKLADNFDSNLRKDTFSGKGKP